MYTTIFIHGTLPPRPFFTVPAIERFFFCKKGLEPAISLGPRYGQRVLADILCRKDPVRFSIDQFYFYGWSGKLSRNERKLEAEKLFDKIRTLRKPLRIITYSHGGNIALQLATIAHERKIDDFEIDELILLACPVQKITRNLTDSAVFKTIFSIHSHKDMFQVIDPQGLHELADLYKDAGLQKIFMYLQKMECFFSERHFLPAKNIHQIHVKINQKDLWHIEFILPTFFSHIPEILDCLEQRFYIQNGNEILINIER